MNPIHRLYSFLRSNTCPFGKVAEFVPPKGRILDLGCGFGLFSMMLSSGFPERRITAIDCEQSRINAAEGERCGAGIKNCTFLCGDIAGFDYGGPYDCVLLVDVLYQFDKSAKAGIIDKCRDCLNPDGLLIVKEMDRRPLWKFAWCYIQEAVFARALRLNKKKLELSGAGELSHMLRKAGFSVKTERIDKGYAYPHILFVCRKGQG
jgi:2-polyprenyl-3-methyl-5-hydroxy-6-metoxy-1,4-benzoquinol methylase